MGEGPKGGPRPMLRIPAGVVAVLLLAVGLELLGTPAWGAVLGGAGAVLLHACVLRRKAPSSPRASRAPETRKEDAALGELILKENLTSLGRLASGLAHEFGNPLTTISSVAQLLRRRRRDDDFVREQAEVIEAHVKRLSRLNRQLVDLAFPRRPKMEVFDVHEALEDTVRLAWLDRRLRDVEIERDLAGGPLRVRADAGAFHLILLNLLFNAADAMEGKGKVTLETRIGDLGAEIRVRDTGPGVPEEIRSRIFAPFFTTKEPGAGTGIGLTVSCRLARAIGGELNLERSGERGSSFLLLLSLAEEADEVPPARD